QTTTPPADVQSDSPVSEPPYSASVPRSIATDEIKERATPEGMARPGSEGSTPTDNAHSAQALSTQQNSTPLIASNSESPSETTEESATPYLAYAPDKPIFASKKVEIKELFKDQSKEDWKENYNVNSSYFDQHEALSATSHKRKLHIGGAVSPIYSFRQTADQSNLATAAAMTANYSEKGLTSTGGGIHINLEIGRNWGIESGVRYARMGQEVHADIQSSRVYAMNTDKESYGTTTLKTISLDNSLGNIKQPQSSQSPQFDERETFANSPNSMLVDIRNDETVTSGQMEQFIDYVEIPLTFRYYVINASAKLSLAAGLSTNWLVANNAYLSESGKRQKIGETSGLSTMNFSTHAGIAFSIPVYGPLSFRVEPRINYFINEINREHPVKFKPYSVGVYSGIQYTIGE
ncbi:MAG: outer membrane beta-barrel protein, partial [Bacteroidales bacterium]|nr:outer membrane beta-barrel protein [Bacteroidales bacterium]